LEVVKPSLGVVDIAAVAEGVEDTQSIGHGAGGGEQVAPGIVGVLHHHLSAAVEDAHHIALQVGDVEIGISFRQHAHGRAVGRMGKVDRLAVILHVLQTAAVVHIFVGIAAACALGAQTVGVIGVLPCNAVLRDSGRVALRCLTADEAEHKRVPRSIADAAGLSARKMSGTANGREPKCCRTFLCKNIVPYPHCRSQGRKWGNGLPRALRALAMTGVYKEGLAGKRAPLRVRFVIHFVEIRESSPCSASFVQFASRFYKEYEAHRIATHHDLVSMLRML